MDLNSDYSSSDENLMLFPNDVFKHMWNDCFFGTENIDSTLVNDGTNAGPSREISSFDERTTVITSEIPVSNPTIARPSTHREGQIPSSLPATQNWPGDYGFNISFGPQEQISKTVAWTYSPSKDKLYVGKDAACPINFSTSQEVPEGTYIRATALFSMSEHVSDVVRRCVNHSIQESTQGLPEAEHLVRCECDSVSYEVDSLTRRHSVVVPFENSPAGQGYSTYIYKFACFGSCAGGPNRRPLMVIFTLEKNKEVLGRKKLDVKICACPGRDRNTDEQQSFVKSKSTEGTCLKRKHQSEFTELSDTFEFIKTVTYPSPRKTKTAPNKDGYYVINVTDPHCFNFLKSMKKFYGMCQIMKASSPDLKKKLLQLCFESASESE